MRRVSMRIAGHEIWKLEFEFSFTLPPKVSVKEEYLITNEISLIGNVGGTLGMFVGFSFIGTIEWLLEILSKAKNHMKQTGKCE